MTERRRGHTTTASLYPLPSSSHTLTLEVIMSENLEQYRERNERESQAVLTLADDTTGPYGDAIAAYDVDGAMLAEVTSRPVQHITGPNGEPVIHQVALPAGATARVYVYDDADGASNFDDFDPTPWDDETMRAWYADEWHFVGVAATVTLADGSEGESAVWGVGYGDYFPGTYEAQIWDHVPDQISQALHEARLAQAREMTSDKPFTVIGYYDEYDERVVVAVIKGHHTVTGGTDRDNSPFAHHVTAIDADTAEAFIMEHRDVENPL